MAPGNHGDKQNPSTGRNCTHRHAYTDILNLLKDNNYFSATIKGLFGNTTTEDDPQKQEKDPLNHTQKGAYQQLPPHSDPGANSNTDAPTGNGTMKAQQTEPQGNPKDGRQETKPKAKIVSNPEQADPPMHLEP